MLTGAFGALPANENSESRSLKAGLRTSLPVLRSGFSLSSSNLMRYREIKPTLPLQSFVECFWQLEGDGSVDASPPERILPDGCVEAILNFGDRFLQHVDGTRRCQPRNFIVGQMTGPILISASGIVQLLGLLRSGTPDSRLQPVCTADARGSIRQPKRAHRIVHTKDSPLASVAFFQYPSLNLL